MRFHLLLLGVLLTCPMTVLSNVDRANTGAQLLDDCAMLSAGGDTETRQTASASVCLGFFRAVLHLKNSDLLRQEDSQFCPPRGVTASEAGEAIVKTLRDDTSMQSLPYNTAALVVLKAAYPCATVVANNWFKPSPHRYGLYLTVAQGGPA